MKTNLTLTLSLVAALTLPALSLADDDSRSIAKDTSLPGKFQRGQCLPYAKALYTRLTSAGGEAHLVVFGWENTGSLGSDSQGRHAFVVYRDADGRYYGMDNLQWKPIRLSGGNPQQWAESFAGMKLFVHVQSSQTDPALAGNHADLSRVRVAKADGIRSNRRG